jgi:hypothetical protein
MIIRIGEHGRLTHLYDPKEDVALCGSGRNAGRYPSDADHEDREDVLIARRDKKQQFYRAEGEKVTCYRCIKLAQLNLAKSGGKSFLP